MSDLIERTRLAAQILRDIGGQSAMAATVDEAADAIEAARADAGRYRAIRCGSRIPAWVRWADDENDEGLIGPLLDDAIDAAIDAAMAAEGRDA